MWIAVPKIGIGLNAATIKLITVLTNNLRISLLNIALAPSFKTLSFGHFHSCIRWVKVGLSKRVRLSVVLHYFKLSLKRKR